MIHDNVNRTANKNTEIILNINTEVHKRQTCMICMDVIIK